VRKIIAKLTVEKPLLTRNIPGDQIGLFKLALLIFTFKWYNWSSFRLLTV
jgi:hypothetical protein